MASILLSSSWKSPADLDDSLKAHCAGLPILVASLHGVAWRRHSLVTVRACLTHAADQPHVAFCVAPRLGRAASLAQPCLLERVERSGMEAKGRDQRFEATDG